MANNSNVIKTHIRKIAKLLQTRTRSCYTLQEISDIQTMVGLVTQLVRTHRGMIEVYGEGSKK